MAAPGVGLSIPRLPIGKCRAFSFFFLHLDAGSSLLPLVPPRRRILAFWTTDIKLAARRVFHHDNMISQLSRRIHRC